MLNDACNQYGPHLAGGLLPHAPGLVSALTEAQHQQLHRHAATRLKRAAMKPGMERVLAGRTPGDLVNDALEAILAGEDSSGKGRKLPAKARRSVEGFVYHVISVIDSQLSNLSTSAEAKSVHAPAGGEEAGPGFIKLPDPIDPSTMLEQRDTLRAVSEGLEEVLKTEKVLAPVIRYWQLNSEFGGAEFDSNQVFRVRQHIRRILRRLAMEVCPPSQERITGMEMLR